MPYENISLLFIMLQIYGWALTSAHPETHLIVIPAQAGIQ
jgi:hypothetical protein